MLNVMAEPDARDWHALPYDGRDFAAGLYKGIEGFRIAYSPRLGYVDVDPDIAKPVRHAVTRPARPRSQGRGGRSRLCRSEAGLPDIMVERGAGAGRNRSRGAAAPVRSRFRRCGGERRRDQPRRLSRSGGPSRPAGRCHAPVHDRFRSPGDADFADPRLRRRQARSQARRGTAHGSTGPRSPIHSTCPSNRLPAFAVASPARACRSASSWSGACSTITPCCALHSPMSRRPIGGAIARRSPERSGPPWGRAIGGARRWPSPSGQLVRMPRGLRRCASRSIS